MKLRKMIQNARTENGATGCLRTLACVSRLPDMSRHVLYVMFTQDLDLRWHVYGGMFMQLRAACVAHVAFEYEVPNSHSLILTI